MARALTAVGAALVAAILGLGLAVYLTRDEEGFAVDNLLAEEITRAIGTAEERGEDVDLAALTDFEWDEVVIAERTVTHDEISRELGHEWRGDLRFRTGDLLIFVRDGRATRFADYRGEGRFAGIERPFARLAREEAVFSVRSLVIRPRGSSASSSPSSPG
jgi:hypothetical protein